MPGLGEDGQGEGADGRHHEHGVVHGQHGQHLAGPWQLVKEEKPQKTKGEKERK